MPDFDDGKLEVVETLPYNLFGVGSEKVALLGLFTDDKPLFRKGAFRGAATTPISTSARSWYQIKKNLTTLQNPYKMIDTDRHERGLPVIQTST